jgi:hypothetical protein
MTKDSFCDLLPIYPSAPDTVDITAYDNTTYEDTCTLLIVLLKYLSQKR